MKPPPFTYHRPDSREEVDALLARHDYDAKILAGGQSLVPLLNLRFAAPLHIVDINRLAGEPTMPVVQNGWVSCGPLVRQAAAEYSPEVARRVPLLAEALKHVAHPAIRSRGTIAGSIAHADPAAELPAVFAALGARVVTSSSGGSRRLGAHECFAGPLETTLEPSEWIVEVRWPVTPAETGYAFEEFARRSGDYALCGVAAVATRAASATATATTISLCYFGVGPTPLKIETAPVGDEEFAGSVDDMVAEAVDAQIEFSDDMHASGAYRKWLARRLGARAARRAWTRTRPETEGAK